MARKIKKPVRLRATGQIAGSRGVSLIMVMLILVIVSLLGIGGIQVSMMAERGARNDRDYALARESAELGLMEAQSDMYKPTPTARSARFDGKNKLAFIDGCGDTGDDRGLCSYVEQGNGQPAWLTARFEDTSNSSNTIAFGTFTGRTFANGSAGVQPARAPRYIIEPVEEQVGEKTMKPNATKPLLYRVTSIGAGPRNDIQAVVQMLYRN